MKNLIKIFVTTCIIALHFNFTAFANDDNLLKNADGSQGFSYWEGNKDNWKFNDRGTWETSYRGSANKPLMQKIDLQETLRLHSIITTGGEATFHFSNQYSRTYCGTRYSHHDRLGIKLAAFDAYGNRLAKEEQVIQAKGSCNWSREWEVASLALTLNAEQMSNVDHLVFSHWGDSAEYWRGHYGPAMRELKLTIEPTKVAEETTQTIHNGVWRNQDVRFTIDSEGRATIGDMILTNDANQLLNVHEVAGLAAPSAPSVLVSGFNWAWPNGVVPYEFSTNITPGLKNDILTAMTHISEATSNFVTFVPRQTQLNYIDFTQPYNSNDPSCASFVGLQGGAQRLYLTDSRCYGWHGALHEIMHALGFMHEHQRVDRDEHVSINQSSITSGNSPSWYDKVKSIKGDLTEYDCQSIMHYTNSDSGQNIFSPISNSCIESGIRTNAQTTGLSQKDIIGLLKVYGVYYTDQSLNTYHNNINTLPKQRHLTGDVNGDGAEEILSIINSEQYSIIYHEEASDKIVQKNVDLQVANGDFSSSSPVDDKMMLIDMNGDKKDDIVAFTRHGLLASLSNSQGDNFDFGNHDGSSNHLTSHFSSGKKWTEQKHLRYLVDMNQDNYPDIIGFGDDGIYYLAATTDDYGNLGYNSELHKISDDFGSNVMHKDRQLRYFKDMDNDNIPDLIIFDSDIGQVSIYKTQRIVRSIPKTVIDGREFVIVKEEKNGQTYTHLSEEATYKTIMVDIESIKIGKRLFRNNMRILASENPKEELLRDTVDIDKDGFNDIVIANQNQISILLFDLFTRNDGYKILRSNYSAYKFLSNRHYSHQGLPLKGNPHFADIDGDDNLDIIAFNKEVNPVFGTEARLNWLTSPAVYEEQSIFNSKPINTTSYISSQYILSNMHSDYKHGTNIKEYDTYRFIIDVDGDNKDEIISINGYDVNISQSRE